MEANSLPQEMWQELSLQTARSLRRGVRAWRKRLGKLERLAEEQQKLVERLKAENERLACRVRDLEAQLKRGGRNSP